MWKNSCKKEFWLIPRAIWHKMEIERWDGQIFLSVYTLKETINRYNLGCILKKIPLVIHDTKKWYDMKQCTRGMSQRHCHWLDCDCFPKHTAQSLEPIPSSQRVVSLLRFSCFSFPSDFATSKNYKNANFFKTWRFIKIAFFCLKQLSHIILKKKKSLLYTILYVTRDN